MRQVATFLCSVLMLCTLSFIFSKFYQLYCSRNNACCWYSFVDSADPISRYTQRMLDLEDSQLQSTPLPSTVEATLLLWEVRGSYMARSEVFYCDISLGDDEKVLIWDVVTWKHKYLLEDSGHRWGQITCLSWLGSGGRQDNGLAILCFGTARGLVVIYRQSRTDVGAQSSHASTHWITWLGPNGWAFDKPSLWC